MNQQNPKSIIERIQIILYRVEDSILVGLLLLMITLSVLQIFLRNLLDSGIVWGDVLVRILVLWVGLVGAMVASRQGNHINIDIMERYFPERGKIIVRCVVDFFTALVCTTVAYYSFLFVQMEYTDGGMAFAKVPAWMCEAIIPFAFMVIGIRYFLLLYMNLKRIGKSPS